MNLAALLDPERIAHLPEVSSKKRALEMLSDMLSKAMPTPDGEDIFDSLLARERLGSTGLGHGVAIPHGRMAGLEEAAAALITLDTPVDYDAPDGEPVDILFALIVPEESTEEHLQILAQLAKMFSDNQILSNLREASTQEALLALIQHWSETQV
ncbi:PTS IIA-like nitrogen-regulatory protein PtsN [Ectothiorhodosinus mongolicus]|uniref:PTS IIA-like nitrogen-regulatory protein PtsN n=1 Tax=Ectothiorhodosinus mongolicus TaxID=233100 RepID=A0A1R3VQL1_9GAMM|nr:PTS IIA-like nitrogen regulatory protein PtsN [Ectothiorhodosinus mongolicus]ULX56716.1 PTS IIA-like nitrogen-regulatory protein PtsN [Ectothiorhodosinus mongolicus]SIT66976.1 PTS IIA-like nitrogen-regulatory protein PtsN [Ectothiorhodosinus mongolicus]